jgi:hypothetical protein
MNTSPERFLSLIKRLSLRRGAVFGAILLLALFAFEIFNYSTTDYALTDMLGANLRFLGIRWATILSIAFCGIDFAGIARVFTPEQRRDEPADGCHECHPHLVGRGGGSSQPPGTFCSGHWPKCIGQSRTGFCGLYGLVDPCTHYWYFFDGRRAPVQPGRKTAFHAGEHVPIASLAAAFACLDPARTKSARLFPISSSPKT